MTIAILSLVGGLLLLFVGAEGLVRGSANLGLRLGISPLVVGLTIVAFGTSAPELAVSVNAAQMGQTDVSIANVVGSNIANIGLILGISALVYPITIDIKLIRIDIPILIVASIIMIVLLIDGNLSRVDGVLLFSGVIAFTVFNVVSARSAKWKSVEKVEETIPVAVNSLFKDVVFIVFGLLLLIFGGRFLVDGAVEIARAFGLSEALIGLTIISIGTSLPELATSVLAASKKLSEISVGNVVGSNIFNILCVLGITAAIHPLPLGNITWLDLVVMVLLTIAIPILSKSGSMLKRKEGAALVVGYVGYLMWLVAGVM